MQTEELYRYKIQQGDTLTFLFWKLIVPIDIELKFILTGNKAVHKSASEKEHNQVGPPITGGFFLI
jgi:hypothetical protein